MRNTLTTLLLLLILSAEGYSQAGDFITVKKNGRSYKAFYKGAYVRFFTTDGLFVETFIADIRNDSLFYKPIILQRVGTSWGVTNLDTVATSIRGISYRDIGALPRKDQSFAYIKNGTLLMIAGGGYLLLNLVNGAYLHDPPFGSKNLAGMATASGVLGAGFVLSKLHKPIIRIGKKYTVHYINLTAPKR
jgi:hypothetical protein